MKKKLKQGYQMSNGNRNTGRDWHTMCTMIMTMATYLLQCVKIMKQLLSTKTAIKLKTLIRHETNNECR